MNTEILSCACGANEHVILFVKTEDADKYRSVFISYHLQSAYLWYVRIVKAVKYISGYKSRYGNFGETIIDSSNINKLREIVEFIESKQ